MLFVGTCCDQGIAVLCLTGRYSDMAAVGRKVVVRILVGVFLIASAVAVSAAGQDDVVSARILTTAGETAEGALSGILPTIRLDASDLTNYVGPFYAFDIPRETIRQITLDFPRMVVETEDRVFVGPYSAYRGISELLTLQRGTERLSVPTVSVRAIALHGYGFHPVSREWLANTFLVMPRSAARSALRPAGEETAEQPRTSPPDTTAQAQVPPEPEEETAGWLGAVIVIALIALVLLSLG